VCIPQSTADLAGMAAVAGIHAYVAISCVQSRVIRLVVHVCRMLLKGVDQRPIVRVGVDDHMFPIALVQIV
jgi:hypothetical protein